MGMNFLRKLPIPQMVKQEYPLTPELAGIKKKRDDELRSILSGESDKLILIIGPCSADREDAVLEYVGRLSRLQERVEEKIFFVPRIYTNKPRTTGDGYKGMLHQPDPEGNPDMLKGITSIRQLHIRALEVGHLGCADEMLYPEDYRYLSDVLSYVAIGARSSENQQHRLVASGVDCPVGLKNPTGGDISVMMNSIVASQHSHTFLFRGWEVVSDGNPYAHAILRGYVDKHGVSMPNYHYEDIIHLYNLYQERGLSNPGVIIDTNHSNSGKKFLEQPRIAKEVISNMRYSPEIRSLVKGFMVESYLEDGAQKIGENIYGKSITDPCLGWCKTESFVLELAEML